MTEPVLRAPSANPPSPGRCPNCNGTSFHPIDNHKAFPGTPVGRYVTICAECGWTLEQVIHGRDPNPHPHTSGPPRFVN